MPLFSQRKGIRPLTKILQTNDIDQDLRNRLWSVLQITLWDKWRQSSYSDYQTPDSAEIELIVSACWIHYYKLPLDSMPHFKAINARCSYTVLRDSVLKGPWHDCYDLIEFLYKVCPKKWQETLKDYVNAALESENSAYRLVDSEFVEITSEHEVQSVESAVSTTTKAVAEHFARALDFLSDRKNPDYRNSIKESISAVEAVVQVLADKKSTLGDCLKSIKGKTPIHPALESALLKLYGYTSDEGGIRHALTEKSATPTFADAKFMLVSCSAFVNYLWTNAATNGLAVPKKT